METEDDDPLLARKDGEDGALQPQYRNVGLFSLLVISFFWASGGIYGNEASGNPASTPLFLSLP
jgi:hypothetical protein